MIGSSPLLPRLRDKLRRQPSKSNRSEGSSSTLSLRLRLSFSSRGSFRTSGAEYKDTDTEAQSNRLRITKLEREGACTPGDDRPSPIIIKIFVPDGWGPGREVKVRFGPDGRKVRTRTVVPPRSHWRFENCGGEPRAYFLIRSVDPASVVPSRPTEPRRRAPVPEVPGEQSSVANAGRRASFGGRRSTERCPRALVPNECSSVDEGRRAGFQDAPRMVCQCVPSEGVFDSFCPIHGTDAQHDWICPREAGRASFVV